MLICIAQGRLRGAWRPTRAHGLREKLAVCVSKVDNAGVLITHALGFCFFFGVLSIAGLF